MIQRQRLPHRSGRGRVRSAPPLPPVVTIRPEDTMPPPALEDEEPAILGFPAELEPDQDAPPPAAASREFSWDADGTRGGARADVPAPGRGASSGVRLVVAPRSQRLAGLALVLAGMAAEAALWLPWSRGPEVTGLHLVRQGLAVLGSGPGALGRSGLWQPVVVVLGGGVLFLLGLLLFRRARSHRPAGLLALVVTSAAAAGVVVPLANANWSVRSFGPGMWCAVTVVLLGGLGALKAMLTAPKVRVDVG